AALGLALAHLGGGLDVLALRRPRDAEVAGPDLVAGGQLVGVALERDAPDLEHVGAVGDLQRHVRVLLDEDDRGPLLVALAHEIARSSVLLPAPLLPSTATTAPSGTDMSTPCSARTAPAYVTARSRTSRKALDAC